MLGEIKEGVVDLAGSREGHSINEVVDIDFIKERVENDAFDWECCKALVGGTVDIIRRVQAPRRDAETNERWAGVQAAMATCADAPKAFCDALEFLLDRVNVMRIDAANLRLRLIAPVVQAHGQDYECGKFLEKLGNGTVTLDKTVVSLLVAFL